MNLNVFPHKNHYFNVGLEALQGAKSSFTTDSDTVIVVNLTQWSLKEVVSSDRMENSDSEKILIISNAQLFPLAKYYKLINDNIIAICTESESMKVLRDICSNKVLTLRSTENTKPHLTEKEFVSLRYFLNGESARVQAEKMGVDIKTAFAFRYNLAKKLQVKKLSHLLSYSKRCSHNYGRNFRFEEEQQIRILASSYGTLLVT